MKLAHTSREMGRVVIRRGIVTKRVYLDRRKRYLLVQPDVYDIWELGEGVDVVLVCFDRDSVEDVALKGAYDFDAVSVVDFLLALAESALQVVSFFLVFFKPVEKKGRRDG
jgi:hypothetical protein